MIQRIMYIC